MSEKPNLSMKRLVEEYGKEAVKAFLVGVINEYDREIKISKEEREILERYAR
jgi:hypothetical protein